MQSAGPQPLTAVWAALAHGAAVHGLAPLLAEVLSLPVTRVITWASSLPWVTGAQGHLTAARLHEAASDPSATRAPRGPLRAPVCLCVWPGAPAAQKVPEKHACWESQQF